MHIHLILFSMYETSDYQNTLGEMTKEQHTLMINIVLAMLYHHDHLIFLVIIELT